jgi:NAD+ diphosphatase
VTSWQPEFDPQARPTQRSTVFAFAEGRVVVGHGSAVGEPLHVGRLDGEPAFAARHDGPAPEDAPTLRELLATAPPGLAAAAGRAAQLLEWDATRRFCGRDGTPTERGDEELVRVCPRCGSTYFPRISPAVIMLVERDGRILLARRAGVARALYSCLAGFVEPGETLEETVAREVREEAGIEVADVRYVASQPWPFPSQLMVGFTARWASGELRIDERELGDAQWFDPHTLPEVPPPFTIARRLIDDAVARARSGAH